MSQLPDLNQIQLPQSQALGASVVDSQHDFEQSQLKEQLSSRLQEARGHAGGVTAVTSELKSLIEYLEALLGQKAPDGDDYQKIEYLTAQIKEKSPQQQVGILKEITGNFSAQKGSELEQTVKSLKKDILDTLKQVVKQNKNGATSFTDTDQALGQIGHDQDYSTDELVSDGSKYISTPEAGIAGLGKKPFEKSLAFIQNFADHQQGFFEDSAFKISEFASSSDKSKAAYGLMREADKFWQGEKDFLQELKAAGKSRNNNAELHTALRDLFTLEIQMGSRFDADFANLEKGAKDDSDRTDLTRKISEKKSEIKALHSNLS